MSEIGLFDKLITSIGIPLAIVVMIIIYTKGNVVTETINFFKPKYKKDDYDRYDKLVNQINEQSKIREDNYRNVINETNEHNKRLSIIIEKNTKIMEEQTNINKQLVETNKEICNKMNFKMDSIEDKVNNIIDDIEDLKESTTIIKTRTENN